VWASRPTNLHWSHSLRIELTRSGGFAGLTTKLGELDTSELSEDESREIEAMVEKADVPKLAADSPMKGKGADRFQYHLALEDESGRRELTVSEDQMPDELRPLVERLRDAGSAA
jgi:hypothetical protein